LALPPPAEPAVDPVVDPVVSGGSAPGSVDPGTGTNGSNPSPKPLATPLTSTITGESVLTEGKGKHQRAFGFELDLSRSLDAVQAQATTEYTVLQTLKHRRKTLTRTVGIKTTYDAVNHSVQLVFTGRPRFAQGGRIIITTTTSTGMTNAAGGETESSTVTFFILPDARGVVS
jgi:hypothetical protein